MENDLINRNVFAKVTVPKTEAEEREPIDETTRKLIFDTCEGHRMGIPALVMLYTGIRKGELLALKWEDVDFKSKTIQIRRSMEYRYSAKEWRIGEPKSKSGYRTIPLTEEAVAILKKQKEKNKRISEISTEWKEFVFLCRKGTPVKNSTYDTALFKICDKAKISRFSMHILRHTFATRCIEAGMKPKTLQMLLGHSNIGITMNLYVHTTEEEKKKEMDLVAEALMAM